MSDHDPIDDLTRFGAEMRQVGGDMPLSAADVRRRGDRIRRRRQVLVAGAAAVAVAAVTVPILALTGHSSDPDKDLVTKDPASSKSLGEQNLLRGEDTQYEPGSSGAFHEYATSDGDAGGFDHVCERGTARSLGATASYIRSFASHPPEEASDLVAPAKDGMGEMIAEFPDHATAKAAYDTWNEWIRTCATRLSDYEQAWVDPKPDKLPTGEGVIYDLNWGPAPKEYDPSRESSFINETGLVVQGNRIAVVGLTIVGTDYNFLPEDGGTPMTRMLPVAAERLLPAVPTSTASPTPGDTVTSGAPDAVTTIPDGFPLNSGWPDPEPAGGMTAEGPSRDLPAFTFTVCGHDVPDRPAPIDRMVATWSAPEDGRSRQLSTYATEEDADAAATPLVTAFRDCPDEQPGPDGFAHHHSVRTGDLGDESWVLGTWSTFDGAPAPGIDVTYVVRIGRALLVISGGNEGGASDPEGDIATTASGMADDAAAVIADMCVFTDKGC